MNIITPNINDKNSYYVDPDKFKEICFIFVPYKDDYYIYITGIIKYGENEIRIDPRYYNKEMFNDFLNNTNTKEIFNTILDLCKNSENYNQLCNKIKELKNKNKLVYDILTKEDLKDDPITSWTDYTLSDLSLNEPTGITDEMIEKSIEEYNKKYKNESRVEK